MMILVTAVPYCWGSEELWRAPIVFAAVAAFIGGVGACQVLLFGGQDPRRASFFGGIVTFGVLAVVIGLVEGVLLHDIGLVFEIAFGGGALAVIFGGPLGYAAGCLIAAIFLVRKEPGDAEPPPEEQRKTVHNSPANR